MSIETFEGIVQKGQIKIVTGIRLPEQTKVFIVVPDSADAPRTAAYIRSPRLKDSARIEDFRMEIIEETANA